MSNPMIHNACIRDVTARRFDMSVILVGIVDNVRVYMNDAGEWVNSPALAKSYSSRNKALSSSRVNAAFDDGRAKSVTMIERDDVVKAEVIKFAARRPNAGAIDGFLSRLLCASDGHAQHAA